ncbi:hypothetical protein DFR29_1412 [Tahibacter aquaticus]|uniref:DUF6484 domain-containing protein n=1 Tax=Tahibacter aquaticus TaxID=520092 RepID=A0A4R6YFE1_9GAMM|nr:DUF6484 domain-containing protein [Tahibacter aquaticus]TDR34956.1 hypothetical protein DFR29_1412 [Tahibacter aquaticus]
MKTEPELLAPGAQAADIDLLLQRPVTRTASPPARVDGVGIGTVDALGEQGIALVSIAEFGLTALPARSLCQLDPNHVGRSVALSFEQGDPARPIILGVLITDFQTPTATVAADDASPAEVIVDGYERVAIQARSTLELRCGDAAILMHADGRIEIRGHYITSHATATQRIRGGSVQIN